MLVPPQSGGNRSGGCDMKELRLLLIALAMLGIGLLFQPGSSDAAFHIMRIWEVGGGAYGNTDVQYVELRQAHQPEHHPNA